MLGRPDHRNQEGWVSLMGTKSNRFASIVDHPWRVITFTLLVAGGLGYFMQFLEPSITFTDLLGPTYAGLEDYQHVRSEYTNDWLCELHNHMEWADGEVLGVAPDSPMRPRSSPPNSTAGALSRFVFLGTYVKPNGPGPSGALRSQALTPRGYWHGVDWRVTLVHSGPSGTPRVT